MPVSQVFSNNAGTTLAGPIAANSLSLTIASGTGTIFPRPGTGQFFAITLTDALTGLRREIMHVTSSIGDTFTIQRNQEGTSAQSWVAGDLVQLLVTAGGLALMVQQSQMSSQYGGLSTMRVVNGSPSGVLAGNAQGFGLPPDTVYDSFNDIMWVCVQTGATAAATIWTQLSYARLAGSAVQAFSVAQGTLSGQAVNLGQFIGNNQLLGISAGYQKFPGGFLMQWFTVNIPANTQITPALPIAFPSSPLGCMICYQAALPPPNGSVGIQLINTSQVLVANSNTSNANFSNVLVWGI